MNECKNKVFGHLKKAMNPSETPQTSEINQVKHKYSKDEELMDVILASKICSANAENERHDDSIVVQNSIQIQDKS